MKFHENFIFLHSCYRMLLKCAVIVHVLYSCSIFLLCTLINSFLFVTSIFLFWKPLSLCLQKRRKKFNDMKVKKRMKPTQNPQRNPQKTFQKGKTKPNFREKKVKVKKTRKSVAPKRKNQNFPPKDQSQPSRVPSLSQRSLLLRLFLQQQWKTFNSKRFWRILRTTSKSSLKLSEKTTKANMITLKRFGRVPVNRHGGRYEIAACVLTQTRSLCMLFLMTLSEPISTQQQKIFAL